MKDGGIRRCSNWAGSQAATSRSTCDGASGEQSEESLLRRRLRGRSWRSRWSEGRGPRGIRTSKARTGLRARFACQRRWSVYGNMCRHTPEAGAVCGKAARTDLGGGRAMKRTSLPLLRRRKSITPALAPVRYRVRHVPARPRSAADAQRAPRPRLHACQLKVRLWSLGPCRRVARGTALSDRAGEQETRLYLAQRRCNL